MVMISKKFWITLLIILVSLTIYIVAGIALGNMDFIHQNTKIVLTQIYAYNLAQLTGVDTSWWFPTHAIGTFMFETSPSWGLMSVLCCLILPPVCIVFSNLIGHFTTLKSWINVVLLNVVVGLLLISILWDMTFLNLAFSYWTPELRTEMIMWVPFTHAIFSFPNYSGIGFAWEAGLNLVLLRALVVLFVTTYVLVSELGLPILKTGKKILRELLLSFIMFLIGVVEIFVTAIVTNNMVSPYYDLLHHFTDYFGWRGFFGWAQDFLRYHLYEFFTQQNIWTLTTFIMLLLLVSFSFYLLFRVINLLKFEQTPILRLLFVPLFALVFFHLFCYPAMIMIQEYYSMYFINPWQYVSMLLFWVLSVGIPILFSKFFGGKK